MRTKTTPITIITGYLGSGKTTLLNRILANKKGLKAAVIVNDIGEVNIDATLIEHGGNVRLDGGSLVPLTNGCICCTLQSDLIQQVLNIIAACRFDCIIIEASGICEPLPIARALTFGDPVLPSVCRIDGIVTVVDAMRMNDEFLNGEKLLDDFDEDDIESLLVQQIEYCTAVVINKASSVPPESLGAIREVVRGLQPSAGILSCDYGDVDPGLLIDTRAFNFSRTGKSAGWLQTMQEWDTEHSDAAAETRHHPHVMHSDRHGHDETGGNEYGVSTFVYHRRPGLNRGRFENFVGSAWPEGVIRCKGLIWFSNDPERSYLFEQAGIQTVATPFGMWMASASPEQQEQARRANAMLDENWDPIWGDRMIKLVFIGLNMDRKAICDALDACLDTKQSSGQC